VPAHLLTREAIELYLHKLRPDGLLLFNVSSRFYDFAPVLCAARAALVVHGAHGRGAPPYEPLELPTYGYALARDPARLEPLFASGWRSDREIRPTALWTDDYTNVLAPLVRRVLARFAIISTS
jgi:hypothetical protein